MIAANALLRLLKDANRYGSYITSEDADAALALLEIIHASGAIDLKQGITEDIHGRVKGAAFPVALLGVGSVDVPFFTRLKELDRDCLTTTSRGVPVFVDAIRTHVGAETQKSGSYLNESIDDVLAFWARSIPLDHITSLDRPGDDPGAGLMGHIRQAGAFPELHRALVDLGFDANAKTAGAIPTAANIRTLDQFTAFVENGGDLKQIVPVKWPGYPEGVELWEYIFESQNSPSGKHDLLLAIGSWSKDQDPETSAKYEEKIYWWHLCRAASKKKEDLLEYLRENPGWEDRRDHFGRNALQLAGRWCPSFVNHVLNTKNISHLIDEKDGFGHGAAAHVLPALANYNRTEDAKKIAARLLRQRGRFRDFDEHNECGLIMSYALDLAVKGVSSLPSPSVLYSAIQNSSRSRDLVPLPSLWFASPEQYDQVTDMMKKNIFVDRSHSVMEVALSAKKLFEDAAGSIEKPSSGYMSHDRELSEKQSQALMLFNSMPKNLQQIIAIHALELPDVGVRKSNGGHGIGVAIEKPVVSAWVNSILGDLEISIPEDYRKQQAACLKQWKDDVSGYTRITDLEDIQKMVHAAAQAKELRERVNQAQGQEKSPDCKQSRPSPRF